MPSTRPHAFSRLGCGYLLATVLVSCLLLVFNALIVRNVYFTTAEGLPELLRERRWSQAILFLGPIVLLVVQWWAYDVTVDWLRPIRPAKK
jgi:hypothetical protein